MAAVRVFATCCLAGTTMTASAVERNAAGSVAAIASSGTRDFDDGGSELGAQARAKGEWRWESAQALVEVSAGGSQLGNESDQRLRQAFLDASLGRGRVSVGRQIVAWGRTDRLNPTDNLSSRNLRALVTDSDEERIGADMLSWRTPMARGWRFSAIWVPRLPATRLARGLTADAPLIEDDTGKAGAVRVDYGGVGIDASVSVLHGAATLPAYESELDHLRAEQPRVKILGADLSWQLTEHWGVRAETAYTQFHDDATPPGLRDAHYTVIGLERHLDGGWHAIAQIARRQLTGEKHREGSAAALNRKVWFQASERSDALYLGLNRAAFEGDISGDVGVLWGLSDGEHAWFARIDWRLNDQISLRARHQSFYGDATSNLGPLHRDNVTMLELRSTWGWSQ